MENVRQQSNTNRQGGDQIAETQTAQEVRCRPFDALTSVQFLEYLDGAEASYKQYERMLAAGVSRELARIGLPVNIYTEWYARAASPMTRLIAAGIGRSTCTICCISWRCEWIPIPKEVRWLRFRVYSQRSSEIRDYGTAIFALIRDVVPVTAAAFLDYRFCSLSLTRLEIEAIKSTQSWAYCLLYDTAAGEELKTTNKRERAEWEEKRTALGFANDEPAAAPPLQTDV